MTPLSTHGMKQETWTTGKGCWAPSTPPDSEPGWRSRNFRLHLNPPSAYSQTQCPLYPPSERGQLSCLVPRKPACLLLFVGTISGSVLSSFLTKYPGQSFLYRSRKNCGSCSSSIFFSQNKQLYPRLYEFLPHSYLSKKLFLIDLTSHGLLIKAPLNMS